MGILFSRFRKKKATYDVLEDLETKIQEIEEYRQNTEQRHKTIVGRLIICSVVLYIIAALIFYFYFFPAALYDQIFYMTPLLIFPILILFTKKLVSWYYKRKISRNQTKLLNMQQEKRKILDEVVETETYKKAKEILLKFAPDRLRMTPLSPQPTLLKDRLKNETPQRTDTPQSATPIVPSGGASQLRRRPLVVSSLAPNRQVSGLVTSGPVPIGSVPSYTPRSNNNHPAAMAPRQFNTPAAPRAPLPRPILPQQRSYLDRLVEYLVGDGPSNRYALICKQCESHNGMALKEEFEYFGFRCCYCNFWNPARKQKPSAPKLELDVSTAAVPVTPSFTAIQSSSLKITELISNPSDTDSDIEVVDKPENQEDSVEEKSTSEKEDGPGAVDKDKDSMTQDREEKEVQGESDNEKEVEQEQEQEQEEKKEDEEEAAKEGQGEKEKLKGEEIAYERDAEKMEVDGSP